MTIFKLHDVVGTAITFEIAETELAKMKNAIKIIEGWKSDVITPYHVLGYDTDDGKVIYRPYINTSSVVPRLSPAVHGSGSQIQSITGFEYDAAAARYVNHDNPNYTIPLVVWNRQIRPIGEWVLPAIIPMDIGGYHDVEIVSTLLDANIKVYVEENYMNVCILQHILLSRTAIKTLPGWEVIVTKDAWCVYHPGRNVLVYLDPMEDTIDSVVEALKKPHELVYHTGHWKAPELQPHVLENNGIIPSKVITYNRIMVSE